MHWSHDVPVCFKAATAAASAMEEAAVSAAAAVEAKDLGARHLHLRRLIRATCASHPMWTHATSHARHRCQQATKKEDGAAVAAAKAEEEAVGGKAAAAAEEEEEVVVVVGSAGTLWHAAVAVAAAAAAAAAAGVTGAAAADGEPAPRTHVCTSSLSRPVRGQPMPTAYSRGQQDTLACPASPASPATTHPPTRFLAPNLVACAHACSAAAGKNGTAAETAAAEEGRPAAGLLVLFPNRRHVQAGRVLALLACRPPAPWRRRH